MTLEDLVLQGITIQGRANIKMFDDNGDEVMTFITDDFEYRHNDIPRQLWCENHVGFMYYAAGALQIEIIKED